MTLRIILAKGDSCLYEFTMLFYLSKLEEKWASGCYVIPKYIQSVFETTIIKVKASGPHFLYLSMNIKTLLLLLRQPA